MNLEITCMLSEHRALLRKLLLPLLCALSGCATVQDGEAVDALEYACGDLAVVGRIVTISAKGSPGSDVLPNWRSQYNLQVRIKRVIRGKENRHIVPASANAHAQIRDDRDFLTVLRTDGKGGYTLMTANLWAYRPKLSGPCS